MKDTLMFMMGAAAGIGAYIGCESLLNNKENVKKTMNDLIDDTSRIVKK